MGAIALSGLIVLTLVALAVHLYTDVPPPAIVDAAGCYIDKSKRNDTILLLDATDPYSSRQKADLSQIFNRIWGTSNSSDLALLKPGERFWLVKLSGGEPPSIATPMAGTPICMPAQSVAQMLEMGMDPAGRHDPGLRKLEINFQKERLVPLLDEIVATASESPDSYIFEYIASSLKLVDPTNPHVRIVLVSDLLQNAGRDFPMSAVLHTTPDKFLHSDYGSRVLPDLSKVSFQIYQVLRNKYGYNGSVVRKFWSEVLKAKGASVNWEETLADDAPPTRLGNQRDASRPRRQIEPRSKGVPSRREASQKLAGRPRLPTEPRSKGPTSTSAFPVN